MKAYRSSIPLALLVLFTLAVTPAVCGDDAVVGAEPAPMEWFEVSWSGGTIQVALLRPADETSGPHPVVFALPWGAGSQELVLTFMSSYWSRVPGLQGYYVVSPAVRGSDLEHTADEVIPRSSTGWTRSSTTIRARSRWSERPTEGEGCFTPRSRTRTASPP